MVKLSSISANKENPRKIKDQALKKLAQSIDRDPQFMELRPIVIDSDRTIIGGNQRYAACKLLGKKEVPDNWVVEASRLTEEQKKRFVLIDNAPEGMSGDWDWEALADYDIDISDLGFQDSSNFALDKGNEIDDLEIEFENVYEIVVTCKDEREQEQVYNMISQKGYKCRALSI